MIAGFNPCQQKNLLPRGTGYDQLSLMRSNFRAAHLNHATHHIYKLLQSLSLVVSGNYLHSHVLKRAHSLLPSHLGSNSFFNQTITFKLRDYWNMAVYALIKKEVI